MIRHKSEPEDFIVTERLAHGVLASGPTPTHLYLLTKRNYTTQRAVSHIAKALHLKKNDVRYAGAKDKNALTEQYITIKGASREQVQKLDLKDLTLSFKGYAREHLHLGKLEGNDFVITLRGLPARTELPFTSSSQLPIPNYFDKQRFSTANHRIGLHIIRKEFDKAVALIMQTDDDNSESLRRYLDGHHNDFVGALRLIPVKILLMYVHALQSKLFNDLLSKHINALGIDTVEFSYSFSTITLPKHHADLKRLSGELPLIGFDSDLSEAQDQLLKNEGLSQRDFINRQLPELTLEGTTRPVTVSASSITMEKKDGDPYTGNANLLVRFSLPKGAYATMALKTILARILATEQSDL